MIRPVGPRRASLFTSSTNRRNRRTPRLRSRFPRPSRRCHSKNVMPKLSLPVRVVPFMVNLRAVFQGRSNLLE